MTDERLKEIRRRAHAIKLTFGLKGEPLNELLTHIDVVVAENKRLNDLISMAPAAMCAQNHWTAEEASDAISRHFGLAVEADIYIMGDQPTTCPKCGSRTEFVEIGYRQQDHECLGCHFTFVIEEERDD